MKNKKKGKGQVDKKFFKRVLKLIKIVVPGWTSGPAVNLYLLSIALLLRTYLTIQLAAINGGIVKTIVNRDYSDFVRRCIFLLFFSIPASTVNSALTYFNKKLAIQFRTNLSLYFNKEYLQKMTFYQMTNLDDRISNPDQRLTQDIQKWSESLSNLYSNFSKPLLDMILFSRKLAQLVGWQGPTVVIGWYFMSAVMIKTISPAFGKLAAIEQNLEGEYRTQHSDVLLYSEEIAFYRGAEWEREKVNNSFSKLYKHVNSILTKKFWMGIFDSMLIKYGAVLVGYSVLGLPVFGPGSAKYIKEVGSDPSAITRDYVRNSSLLISLSKAIGKIVISYKDVQNLAGYTSLVYEVKDVLDDLKNDTYQRKLVDKAEEKFDFNNRGVKHDAEKIQFIDVPIISPNGDVLVEKINFQIEKGENLYITGPNGCGKSSLFRIIGTLWPLFAGELYKPPANELFYIPQRPYLPPGSLMDQLIYPHERRDMLRKGITEKDLTELLAKFKLDYLVREGGFKQVQDWANTLAGGEKQKIAMLRLFYHRPMFAILDECTSAMSLEDEERMYTYARELGITLITISHRPTLLQFHEYLLKFDGQGGWEFDRLKHE